MLNSLILKNFRSGHDPIINASYAPFIMMTCQRTLVLAADQTPLISYDEKEITQDLRGKEAYQYLLEVICGLQSHLVGENEIVGQFKQAYKTYAEQECNSKKLLVILEKLFQDAKKIRTNYLMGLSQKTYASIARKHIVGKFHANSVLILGSGQLAEDLINQFKKKITVFISARNEEKVAKLAKEHRVGTVPWNDHQSYQTFPYIVNSIGFEGRLLGEVFFHKWSITHKKHFFVDLGTPSCIHTPLQMKDGVMRLQEIFQEGAVQETYKREQVFKAQNAVKQISVRRAELFSLKKIKQFNHSPHKKPATCQINTFTN